MVPFLRKRKVTKFSMKKIVTRKEMLEVATDLRRKGLSIGFVPTMGFLHEGHMSLVERARKENDVVVVSIFVNPTQFGPNEDFASYPRDLEHDEALLEFLTDYLFCPSVDEMSEVSEGVKFDPGELVNCLCGISRPTHFQGVAQVVSKLFRLVQPTRVYFGQKDYQQTVVVRHLIREHFGDVELVVCSTAREKDGLAMSSRNVYLTSDERTQATVLFRALTAGLALLKSGEVETDVVIGEMEELILQQPLARIDYIDIRTVENLAEVEKVKSPVVLALAVYFGKTRLIDNVLFTPSNAT